MVSEDGKMLAYKDPAGPKWHYYIRPPLTQAEAKELKDFIGFKKTQPSYKEALKLLKADALPPPNIESDLKDPKVIDFDNQKQHGGGAKMETEKTQLNGKGMDQWSKEQAHTEEQKKHFDTLYNDTYQLGYQAGQGEQTELNKPDDNFIKKNPFNFSPKQIKNINLYLNKTYWNAYKVGETDKKRNKSETPITNLDDKKQIPFEDDLDNNPKLFKAFLTALKQDLLKERDTTRIIKPDFFDPQKTLPKVGFLLRSGQTESGKTAHTLNNLKTLLEKGIKCIIWEHSELTRELRLNQWILDNKLEKYIENKQLFISMERKVIFENISTGCVLYIDDCDGFMKIKNPSDRREVSDASETLELIAQLIGFLIIGCHYQSKTSQKEKTIQLRSGGGAVWINKSRHAQLIEKAKTGEKDIPKEDTLGDREESEETEKSFLSIQKGHRPGATESAWWLNDDFELGDKINKKDLSQMIKEKAEMDDDVLSNIHECIDDYFKDNPEEEKMPSKKFYDDVGKLMGIKKTKAYTTIKRSHKYKLQREGFGGKSFIIKK